MFDDRYFEDTAMVRITVQQVTDAWGRTPLLEDVFTSDMRARGFETVRESVFEHSIAPRGQQTLAELRLTDKFSLLATYLITHGHPEHERVTYGLHKNIKMICIGTTEFRAHKHSIYQRTVEE